MVKTKNKKTKRCKKCGSLMKKIYIRLNINDKRVWTPIGLFCEKCEKLIKS